MNISTNGADYPETEGKLLKISEDEAKSYLDKVVKGSIEETLNGLLDAEADERVRRRSMNVCRTDRTRGLGITRGHFTPGSVSSSSGSPNCAVCSLKLL